MKKVLLTVILAVIGMMTATNVMAATVAPSVNETASINEDVFKFLSTAFYFATTDAEGNAIDETAKTAEVNTIITIGEETIILKMGDEEESVLKVLDSTDPEVDAEGTSTMVISCVDEDDAKVHVVLISKADGTTAITFHEENSVIAFLNISVME